MNLSEQCAADIAAINMRLQMSLPRGDSRLFAAMSYSLLGEGKRLRPLLTLASAEACASLLPREKAHELAFPAALSVEYIHTYSLIHDDLPAMDDDDLRRGKPTCHKAFDEATAILAGDALLSDAFGILSHARVKPARQCAELASAIGSSGMVHGQMSDILLDHEFQEANVLDIHRRKTGRLFESACVLGAISVDAQADSIAVLRRCGAAFGLAFQLIDDLIDEGGLVKHMGKAKVQHIIDEQIRRAHASIQPFGVAGSMLGHLVTRALAGSLYTPPQY